MNVQLIQNKIVSNNESIDVLVNAVDKVKVDSNSKGKDWRVEMIEQIEATNKRLISQLEEFGIFAA